MANFMGPMAPPQAAQPQPPQLDVRTNPAQRAQFKNFMTSMSAPMMPTTAPVAPMLAAPNPMDQIDIFDPVQAMASGGVVGGLEDLGKMSGQMVEAVNTVVYGGGQGGGMGGMPSVQPLPDTGQIATQFPMNNAITQFPSLPTKMSPGISTGPGGNLLDMQSRYDEAMADARRQREGGFMGRVVLPGEMSFDDFSEINAIGDTLEPLQGVGSQPYIGNPIFDQVRAFADGGAAGDGGRERGRGDFRDVPQTNFSQGTANQSLGEGGQEMFTDKALAERMFDDYTSLPEVFDINRYLGPASPLFDKQGFSLGVSPAATDTVSQSTPQSLINSPVGNRISAVATMDNPFGLGGVLSGGPIMTDDAGLGIMANYAIPFRNGGFAGGDGGRERGRGGFQGAGDAGFAGGGNFPSETSGSGNQDSGKDDNESNVISTTDLINTLDRLDDDALSRVLDEQFVSPKIEPGDAVVTKNPPVEERSVPIERPSDAQAAIAASRVSFLPPSLDPTLIDVSLPGLLEDEITATPFVRPEPGMAGNFGTGAPFGLSSEDFNQNTQQDIAAAAAQNAGIIDGFKFSGVLSPDEMIAARNMSQQMLPIPDELSGQSPFTSGGVPSPLQQTMQSYFDPSFTGEENEDATQTDLESLFRDQPDIIKNIMERSTPFKSETFPTMAGILGKAMGGANINNIINKINEGGVPQLDAQGNIQGVVHDGFFGKVYSGNEEYNPFAGPKPEREENVLPILPIPEAETPLTVAPPMIDPTLPVTPPNPTDVIVPSTRTDVPVTVPVIAPTPIESILPQSLLDLLQARQPVAQMANGGAVLDDAAGRFLEALTAA